MYCRKCDISVINDFKPCFRSANEGDILFIGEAPGHTENKTKIPFTGKAGTYLRKVITTYGLLPFSVFTNVIKCQPPRNRDPFEDEIANCKEYLLNDLSIIKPKIIVTLGTVATKLFIDDNNLLMIRYINKPFTVGNTIIIPLYHPSYILRENKGAIYADSFNIISEFYNAVNPYYTKRKYRFRGGN